VSSFGKFNNTAILTKLATGLKKLPDLQCVVMLDGPSRVILSSTYQQMIFEGENISRKTLQLSEAAVGVHDICNLQFTSGTTGNPKAAMLTHQ
jgi:mevalonyl-CoA ligase